MIRRHHYNPFVTSKQRQRTNESSTSCLHKRWDINTRKKQKEINKFLIAPQSQQTYTIHFSTVLVNQFVTIHNSRDWWQEYTHTHYMFYYTHNEIFYLWTWFVPFPLFYCILSFTAPRYTVDIVSFRLLVSYSTDINRIVSCYTRFSPFNWMASFREIYTIGNCFSSILYSVIKMLNNTDDDDNNRKPPLLVPLDLYIAVVAAAVGSPHHNH